MHYIATQTVVNIQWDYILGGFALFMFAIGYMGDGLKNIAGEKLRDVIDKYTNKPWKGILVGIIVTIFIQSSIATTAIAIGFVRAGLMSLEQTVGITFGANIGTTVTSFLIGLNIQALAMYFVFIGVMLQLFAKRKKQKYLGQIILGFGLIFFGFKLMGDELSKIGQYKGFTSVAKQLADQPILSMLGGTVLTALIQSSAAAIGIVQKLYASGSLQLVAVLPFVFGSNIGTTITACIAAIGGSTAAKRTAGIHVMFNVTGTIVFMIFLYPVTAFISNLGKTYNLPPMLQIATAHIIFNITMTILLYPCIGIMVKAIKKIIKGDDGDRIELDVSGLDISLINTLPAAAISSAQTTTQKMAELAMDEIKETQNFFESQNNKYRDSAIQLEDGVNSFDSKITSYLIEISHQTISQDETDRLIATLQVIKNIERIGDISMNLVNFYDSVFDEKYTFTEGAINDVTEMSNTVIEMVDYAMNYFSTRDPEVKQIVEDKENYLDILEEKAKRRHFKRMAERECQSTIAASVYVDIITNLERMGDHAENIVKVLDNPAADHELKIKYKEV